MYKKLEADLQTSKKRHVELVEQCKNLKKGREESVSALGYICFRNNPFQSSFIRISLLAFLHWMHQDEREEALEELKATEQKHKELKVETISLCFG